MKIIIPGGSGQVGTILARAFHGRGDEVVVLGRKPSAAPWRTVQWDAARMGPWAEEFEGADVVINLAGRSVNCRYNARNRADILDSRVNSTRVIGEAIAKSHRHAKLWLQASTATIYAHRFDAPNDERTGILGGNEPKAPGTWRFSIDVAKAWERAVDAADVHGTRKVKLRSAMIMSPDPGGIFDALMGLVRKGLGGRAGDGRQFISWVHEEDFIRAVMWLIEHEEIEGNVNIASPNPLPNKDFMAALRKAAGMPIGLPATRLMLEIGAIFMRTETELILKSRRVIPGRILAHGFRFNLPDWPQAAADLTAKWHQMRGAKAA